MKLSWQTQFETNQTQWGEISAQIKRLSDEQRTWKPSPRDWSALQIAEHLVLSAETVGSPDWAKRKIESSGIKPGVHPGRYKFIVWALRRGIRLPLPSPEFEPHGQVLWPEIEARWAKTNAALGQFLNLPERNPEERPFFHTIAGLLSVPEMLELNQVHNAYHARQLSRLIVAATAGESL